MLTGAGLSRVWPHHRAHYFFARARWQPGDLGLALARLAVALLVPAGQPVTVAIDDTLFRHRGKKIWAGLPHSDAAVAFEAQALAFLVGRFTGGSTPDGCASIGQGNSLAPLPQPAS